MTPRGAAGARLTELGGVAPLGAVALLVANDRVGKPLFHNALTGKLSDVAICFLLPLLVSATLGLFVRGRGERRLWVGALVGAAVFALLEMSDAAGGLFLRALGALGIGGVLTRDPTDLAALACVPLAVAYGRARLRAAPRHPRWATAAGALALVTGSLALMATSAPAKCGKYTAPVVFQVDGDCGPGGLVVVEADEFVGALKITNPGALGLPPLNTSNGSSGVLAQGHYDGDSCPYTFANGEWQVMVNVTDCSRSSTGPADAGAAATHDAAPGDAGDAGGPGDGGDAAASGAPAPRCPTYRTCTAALEDGTLWFTCDGGDDAAAASCRSRLTVLP